VLREKYCGVQEALTIFQPATLVRWHRNAFSLFWRWRSRPGHLQTARGEDAVVPEAPATRRPLFTGQRGPLTRNGVWRIVKRLMAAVELDPRYATHSCRHTYATHLYRASAETQEALGHANIKTTTVYAKITKEDKLKAANALGKAYRDSQQKRQKGASWPRRALGRAGVAA
jgi:integrase